MAAVIKMKDEQIQVVMGLRDFLYLVDHYMGDESCRWLEEFMEEKEAENRDYDDLFDYTEKMRVHYKEVMEKLRQRAEKLAGLIQQRELDRKAISNTAGSISVLTWKEANRC